MASTTLIRSRAGLALVLAMLLLLVPPAPPAHAANFVVNSLSDSDDGACQVLFPPFTDCTLREAINAANNNNNNPAVDTITFNLDVGTHTINPISALPVITEPVIIDGGGTVNTNLTGGLNASFTVTLDGSLLTSASPGLEISTAGSSTIKGLIIRDFRRGIRLDAGGHHVEGNEILDSSSEGILIAGGSGSTIGGTTAAARNRIAGNAFGGINAFTGEMVVQGNLIGLDASGIGGNGNGFYSIYVQGSNNTIGGSVTGARNIISANDYAGIFIFGNASTGNQVLGNFIGTNAAGTADLGNSYFGVQIVNAPNNTIGGTAAGARNVISGNGLDGVLISGIDATGNQVLGNFIGTNAAGTADLGNTGHGVFVDGASANTVGGTAAGARNVISGNASNGVLISGTGATGNQVLGNYVGTNASGSAGLSTLT